MAAAPKVPKYCLHRPSGRAYVRVQRKAIYLGEYGSAESHAAYSRVVADVLSGRPVAPHLRWSSVPDDSWPKLTVGELVDKYRAHCKSYYRKGGKATSEVHIVKSATDRLIKQHNRPLRFLCSHASPPCRFTASCKPVHPLLNSSNLAPMRARP